MGICPIISLNTQTSHSHIAEHASPFRQFAALTDTFPYGAGKKGQLKHPNEQFTYRRAI